MKRLAAILAAAILATQGGMAAAQHLWWNLGGQTDATCLYGEITVLATHPAIYYCGANWHPGEPAGGYCGIQDNSRTERRTIFSIWDTSPELHPRVIEADPRANCGRFGGEGTGAHTHMLWKWKTGETFQFFVRKTPSGDGKSTETRYYFFDRDAKKWLHSATISNPNGKWRSVATIGGGVNSFLENFAGRDNDVPRVALYRLWLGKSVDKLEPLTRAVGDGRWGQMHDAYFLAAGDHEKLSAVLASLEKKYGRPAFGGAGAALPPLTARPLPADTLKALEHLPRAAELKVAK
jgi:hypothetical protein